MVALSEQYNFASVIDEFVALKPFTGPHGDFLRERMRHRALEILSHQDIRYMPAFKLLDLVAEMVNTASAIAEEPQLRRNEAQALLDSHISNNAPLIAQFILEAALERARYEPMMLEANDADALAYRNLTLTKRWQAMLAAHQAHSKLPVEWSQAVSAQVALAIASPTFAEYRVGPLLQFFAEMLATARQFHETLTPLDQLAAHIGEQSPLWKRYALKATRYREHASHDPYEDDRDLPAQSRVPAIPLPAKHSLH